MLGLILKKKNNICNFSDDNTMYVRALHDIYENFIEIL